MKKILFLILFVAFISPARSAAAVSYKLDDQQVEALFDQSCDISLQVPYALQAIPSAMAKPQEDDKQMVAGIIAVAELITGIGILIPIHRIYLGLGNGGGKIIVGYVCTASGCGIILLVDAIVLLMDSQGSKYINNPKFIMWKD